MAANEPYGFAIADSPDDTVASARNADQSKRRIYGSREFEKLAANFTNNTKEKRLKFVLFV